MQVMFRARVQAQLRLKGCQTALPIGVPSTSKPRTKVVARAPFEEEFPMADMNPKRLVPRDDFAGHFDSGMLPNSPWRQPKPGYVPKIETKIGRIPELVNVDTHATPIKRRTFHDVTMDEDYASAWPGTKKHGQLDKTYDSVRSNKITDETMVSNWEREVGIKPKLARQKRSGSSIKQMQSQHRLERWIFQTQQPNTSVCYP